MNTIKFSHNWNNKLNNDIFTTIRNWTPEKEKYYRSQVNEMFQITLKGTPFKLLKLINLRVLPFNRIDEDLVRLDTGMSYSDAEQLFFNFKMESLGSKMIILTLAKPQNRR